MAVVLMAVEVSMAAAEVYLGEEYEEGKNAGKKIRFR